MRIAVVLLCLLAGGLEADLATLATGELPERFEALRRIEESGDSAAVPGLLRVYPRLPENVARAAGRTARKLARRASEADLLDALVGAPEGAEAPAADLLAEARGDGRTTELAKRLRGEDAAKLAPLLARTGRFEAVNLLLGALSGEDEADPAPNGKRRFNVVFFNDHAFGFRPVLCFATKRRVEQARAFVERINPVGGTNLEAGLRAALRDPDTREIVLLSDGVPNRGGVNSVADVMKLLGDRKVRIHVVTGKHGSHLLRLIAKRTGGTRGRL